MNRYKIIYLISFALVYTSCKKDPQPSTYNPTFQTINVPSSGQFSLPELIVPIDNPTTKEGVALGRLLFYDPILSADNTQSCGSCHHQENAFTDANNKFSKGIDGSLGTRNSMPLFNLAWAPTLFWDGTVRTLEEQALLPIESPIEMKSNLNDVIAKLNNHTSYPELFFKAFGTKPITKNQLAKAIAQFERTIVSADSKFDKVMRALSPSDTFTAKERRGFDLFRDISPTTGGDCIHCHILGSTFTDFAFRMNGIDATITDKGRNLATGNASDLGKFKTPTLRNIALTAPYMHDGRLNTLDKVMEHYNVDFHFSTLKDPIMDSQLQARLTDVQIQDIISFLHTLTDSSLLTNPAFSKPKP